MHYCDFTHFDEVHSKLNINLRKLPLFYSWYFYILIMIKKVTTIFLLISIMHNL